jgi:malate dehydrogenase (quinone)
VDGSVDISKALSINQRYETSKHFWGNLVEQGVIEDPSTFIRPVPHMSFVRGADNQQFLRRRHEAMTQSHLFEGMEYSTDPAEIAQWAPLLGAGRAENEPIAATRISSGTDVNYGSLTTQLIDHLVKQDGVELALETKVRNLKKQGSNWIVSLDNKQSITTPFVFIGAGGGALPLLQKSGIPEGKGYGGFPVSGKFLICSDQSIVERHTVKVYGKAAVGAPPMSVPHLDSRVIDGQKSLLFGPFAGFSPKYLKSGSNMDLFKSIKGDNLGPMLAAGRDNMPLTSYLIGQCTKSHHDRCDMLREFFPDAKNEDWKLIIAGQRVQIIKKDEKRTGRLQFGTEVVTSADGSLSSVLGASPGASTAVSIILQVLEKCFPRQLQSEEGKNALRELVPAYGVDLAGDKGAFLALGSKASELLKLI